MRDGAGPGVGAFAVGLVREAVERYVRTGHPLEPPPDLPRLFHEPGAAFVSLRMEGWLRGCIGRFIPARPRLVDDLLASAILAATRDPRYPPVRPHELAELRYEVSLLEGLEPVDDLAGLDPRTYGLVVQGARRRGGLLPGVPGVETAAQQVVIARIKAGVQPEDPVRLFRFRARHYGETGSGPPGDPREPG
jgi:AmmeMemoRadiSam system protein A